MTKFIKNQIPWNKGIPTKNKRCEKCGLFIGKNNEHICKSVDDKGIRYCEKCGVELKNNGWERYSKICGSCGKKIQRENERILREELIKLFGGKCEKCGYNEVKECLEFHHKYKEDKKNKHFLNQIKKYPERFNLFCNRCHRELHVLEKTIKMKHQLKFDGKDYFLDGNLLTPERSLKFRNHSPTGFNHGYGGSGPAQLALAIMLELTGKAEGYQDFKWKIIAGLPQTDFEIEFETTESIIRKL